MMRMRWRHETDHVVRLWLMMMIFFFYFFLIVMGNHAVGAELSSREEMMQMAGYGEEKLSTVTICGKLICPAYNCEHHHQELAQPLPWPPAAIPVSGASVAVFCGTSRKLRKSWARSTTDEYGDFLIDVPSHLHAIPNLEKVCLLKVLHLPKHCNCRPSFAGKHSGIKLLSVGDGSRAYTANTINLKPSKKCNKTPRNRKESLHVY